MEALYTKLYNKYKTEKTRKFAELEQSGQDQEEKFLNCLSSADELIDHLRSENERMHSRLDELNEEVHSLRSSSHEHQKILTQECEKTKELSKEVVRLQKLQQEGLNAMSKEQNTDYPHFDSSGDARVGSADIPTGLRKKPRRRRGVNQPDEANQLNLSTVASEYQRIEQELCSKRKSFSSGDCMSAESMLQSLMESLVSLTFTFDNEAETDTSRLIVVHQSSGYSFTLTWVFSKKSEEAELLYQVSSFGTIERVATYWMKEDIMFSLSMFPHFLERVSKVIGVKY